LLEGRPFLLGDALTLADITAGTSLYRYFELEIERPRLA
jgi:glutathione S-transferase